MILGGFHDRPVLQPQGCGISHRIPMLSLFSFVSVLLNSRRRSWLTQELT